VKFERNRAAELERCNRFSNCRTLGAIFQQLFYRVGGPRCRASAADENLDIGAKHYCSKFLIFCSVFKSQRSECVYSRKSWQKYQNRGGLVESSVRIIRATPRF